MGTAAMKAVVLAGGYGTRLWPLTQEIPKCFLDFGGRKLIEAILERLDSVPEIDEVLISTNRKFEEQFRQWLSGYRHTKALTLVVDNPTSDNDKLGAIGALDYLVHQQRIHDDLMIVAGDNLFECDLTEFVHALTQHQAITLAINNVRNFDTKQQLGVVELNSSKDVVSFIEKPETPTSTLVCTGLYLFPRASLGLFKKYLDSGRSSDNLGYLFEWLLQEKTPIRGWEFEEEWFDIGTFKPYLAAKRRYESSDKIAKVLVTGGSGYLGGVLIPDLLKEGYDVRVLDTLLYDFAPDDRVEFIKGDVRDPKVTAEALRDVDLLVHLAALSNDPSSDLFPNETVEINYNATNQTFRLAQEAGIRRMVFISSCSIYGATEGNRPAIESDALQPISLYAQMKVAAEMELKKLHPRGGTDLCILRFPTLYGHSPFMRFDLIANIIPVEAVVDHHIQLFGGAQFRPLLHIRDAARSICVALKSATPFEARSFNVGSNANNYSVRDLTNRLRAALFPEVPIQEQSENVDPRSYQVSFDAFERETGFKAKEDLVDGVGEVAEHITTGTYGAPREDSRFFRVRHLKKRGFGMRAD
jgi:nucleoside-diphosphate-sugar epimerase/dTDP-glucose pyrophosphorylase